MKKELVSKRVVKAIEDALKDRMGRYGFVRAQVRPDLDHDGDEALFIDAEYEYLDRPIDASATIGLIGQLRDALEKVGESRFPYVRHHFDERQQVGKSA